MNASRCILLGLIIVFAAGCAGTNKGRTKAQIPSAAPFSIQPMYRITLADKNLPADVKLVAGTILARMALQPDIPKEIAFSPKGAHQLFDPTFDYAGFALRGFDLLKYEAESTGKKSAMVDMSGVLHLQDALDRRTSVTVLAKYEVTTSLVTVLSSSIHPVQPAFPRIQCFFVPETALKAMPKGSLSTFLDWYAFALRNSISMTPSAAERERLAKWDTLSTADKSAGANPRQRYAILVFAMNRVLEPGSLTMGLCTTPGSWLNANAGTFMNHGGWRIGVMGAEFSIDDHDQQRFVEVRYTPDTSGTAGEPYPLMVGLFSTSKNHAPVKTQAVGQQRGIFESGARFLDPKNTEDAKLIQARLTELGFYQAAVDGLFGKGSRAALAKFKSSKGLGNNSNWDLPTQQSLFAGTGQ